MLPQHIINIKTWLDHPFLGTRPLIVVSEPARIEFLWPSQSSLRSWVGIKNLASQVA